MNTKLKIATNTLAQLLGKLITTLTTLLATALIARSYGPVGFGDFTKITTFVALFYLIGDFGFNAVVLEKLQNPKDQNQYFRNLFGLRLLWSLFLVFFALSLLALIPQNPFSPDGFNTTVRLGIIIFSLSIITQGLTTTTNVVFQHKLRYDLPTLALFLGSLLNLALVVGFTSQNLPLLFIILSFLLGNLATSLFALFLTKIIYQKILLPSFNPTIFKELFQKSFPLGITLVFNLIYFRADTFILALTRTTQEVGNYGLAYRFFEATLVFPTFLLNSLYPLMLARKNNLNALIQLTLKSSKFLLGISLLTTLFFLILSPFLINLTGGQGFETATLALRLLSLSFPAFFLSSLFMWLLVTLGKRTELALVYGLSMILNIFLNLLFIPRFGIPAAALTTIFGETIILTATMYLGQKYLKKHDQNSITNLL